MRTPEASHLFFWSYFYEYKCILFVCTHYHSTHNSKPRNIKLCDIMILSPLCKSWIINLITTQPPPEGGLLLHGHDLPVWRTQKESPAWQSKNKLVHHFYCCIGHQCASLTTTKKSLVNMEPPSSSHHHAILILTHSPPSPAPAIGGRLKQHGINHLYTKVKRCIIRLEFLREL